MTRTRVEIVHIIGKLAEPVNARKEHVLAVPLVQPRLQQVVLERKLHAVQRRRVHLLTRTHVLHAVLGSVPVVNVEIDDGHSGELWVRRTRVRSANRHVVQQTEALTHVAVVGVVQRAAGPDVVAWRAHAAERVAVALLLIGRTSCYLARRSGRG